MRWLVFLLVGFLFSGNSFAQLFWPLRDDVSYVFINKDHPDRETILYLYEEGTNHWGVRVTKNHPDTYWKSSIGDICDFHFRRCGDELYLEGVDIFDRNFVLLKRITFVRSTSIASPFLISFSSLPLSVYTSQYVCNGKCSGAFWISKYDWDSVYVPYLSKWAGALKVTLDEDLGTEVVRETWWFVEGVGPVKIHTQSLEGEWDHEVLLSTILEGAQEEEVVCDGFMNHVKVDYRERYVILVDNDRCFRFCGNERCRYLSMKAAEIIADAIDLYFERGYTKLPIICDACARGYCPGHPSPSHTITFYPDSVRGGNDIDFNYFTLDGGCTECMCSNGVRSSIWENGEVVNLDVESTRGLIQAILDAGGDAVRIYVDEKIANALDLTDMRVIREDHSWSLHSRHFHVKVNDD
ncbi:MAG TPA: hypothetical protein ENG16_01465 [Archaeoglobus sp.]|nr:hypothetical protein [Archaeoglobus sp.]